ncbi:NAD(P)/FAD-dependent oxidoreductase [Gordonia sp. TBRC 11910]|uniref:NAD(P)/FAD-dependent oxidoreductase n=1 Tax=Gordonia asplenii TaxID=2725283 RepID=A0A848KYK0_9ACTN|nr:NAD(P)/FAD-dependent oxidoreductase [Gordonia asplenii]NMO03449.1 NAD(P)/FAD-dependent oxidoreductase [Gordonia asplenii]
MSYDAVVVGSGPNGLTAAITFAEAGWSVLVIEGADTIGGGLRSSELFEAGNRHDVCAAVHPLGFISPAWMRWPLDEHGLRWLTPDVSFTHVFDAARTLSVERSWEQTLRNLGVDAARWRRVLGPLSGDPARLARQVLSPLSFPDDPRPWLSFGPRALCSTDLLTAAFTTDDAKTAFAAVAAHGIRPTSAPASAAAGLLLTAAASTTGWPIARGGSQAIADALAGVLHGFSGRVETGWQITAFDEIPRARAVLFDTSPTALAAILGDRLPAGYRRRLAGYRYGPGVCKVDYLLSEPIPWRGRDLARTATFHLATSYDVIRTVEADVAAGRHPLRPWLLGGEPTRIDPSRAASNRHVAWSYCHVPHGSDVDMSEAMTAEIERCAPGFRDVILASRVITAADYSRYNPNLVGGDIGCGASSLRQLLARPVMSANPYATPVDGVYLCSSATPPGGGAHGMSGYNAARAILRMGNLARRTGEAQR